jgi:hypothetical protein
MSDLEQGGGAPSESEQLVTVSTSAAMRSTLEAVIAASRRGTRSILLWGEGGAGKEHLARIIASKLGHEFVSVRCDTDERSIRRWLFELRSGNEDDGPGFVGRSSPMVLYLGGLESVPASLVVDLEILLRNGIYVDASGSECRRGANLRIVGGMRTIVGRQPSLAEVLVRAFGQVIRVPPLRERPEDLIGLAEHYLARYETAFVLTAEAAEVLRALDYSDSESGTAANADRLKELINRTADRVIGRMPSEILQADLEAALIDDLAFIHPPLTIRGEAVNRQGLNDWVMQFPADLRVLAVQLLNKCLSKYYCNSARWWQSLRQLADQLVDDVSAGRQWSVNAVFARVVLSMLQPPGESESRAVADFTKVVGGSSTMRRLSLDDLLAALSDPAHVTLPRELYLVFIDDWMGSGEQMSGTLREYAPKLQMIAEACKKAGRTLSVRVLCVGCYIDAKSRLSEEPIWQELNAKLLVAWELGPEDMCVGDGQRVVSSASDRDRLEAFTRSAALSKENPLGWPPGGLLVVFEHNIPNNTLPLIWADGGPLSWRPLGSRR